MLRKNEETPTRSGKVTGSENQKVNPVYTVLPKPEADPAAYLRHLLVTGQLEAFGERKRAVIADKIDAGDAEWLGTLARSRALGQVLGVAA